MIHIYIYDISGATLPVNVFVSDIYGGNQLFLGTINSAVPPTVEFTLPSPSVFDGTPQLKIILKDSESCEVYYENLCYLY